MTARDLIKDKTATIRYNEELLKKYDKVKEQIQSKENKSFSDGETWIYCLNLALNNPVNVNLVGKDKGLKHRKQIRVSNVVINDIGKLKKELNKHTTIKKNSDVWRYSLKLAYMIVGSGYDDK